VSGVAPIESSEGVAGVDEAVVVEVRILATVICHTFALRAAALY
jgi:hypothetical protein